MLEITKEEAEFLSQFIQLENESIETILRLMQEGHLYSSTGPRSWNMHKFRKPNKSGADEKRLLWLQRKGRLYSNI